MLDADETGFLFNDPLLVVIVPGSGHRLEVIGSQAGDSIAKFIKLRWLETNQIRIAHTEPGREYDGCV